MPGFYIGSLLIMAVLWYNIYGPDSMPVPVQGPGLRHASRCCRLLVLAARPTAQIAQVTASLMAAELDKQHIVTAAQRRELVARGSGANTRCETSSRRWRSQRSRRCG